MLLIGPDHGAQVLGVELCSERRRSNQIAEQHRHLATLGFSIG
jgi:hypothetical protein